MILIGESTGSTTIRLTDHASGFDDPAAPRGIIMTTAKLLDGTPTSGGKDYTHKGEGNDAYENFVEDLTIDAGNGNPGAVGIDYLANNIGAIRDVRVMAPAGSGAIGIAMQRKWPGPALLRQVEVDGFDTGIAVANTEYGVTLDHVRLTGQHRVGLQNSGNAVSAADLTIETAGTAIANTAPGGLVTLTHSVLRRGGEDGSRLPQSGGDHGAGRVARRVRAAGGSQDAADRGAVGRAVAAAGIGVRSGIAHGAAVGRAGGGMAQRVVRHDAGQPAAGHHHRAT